VNRGTEIVQHGELSATRHKILSMTE